MMDLSAFPPDVARLCVRAAEFLGAGRPGAARPLIAAARRLGPPSPAIAELSAALAINQGELAAAHAELDAAIGEWPASGGLRVQRAGLRRLEGNFAGAAEDAAEAVLLDAADPHAKAMLGTSLLDLGQTDDASACLAEALTAQPGNTLFRLALSRAQAAGNARDAARATLREGLRLAPDDLPCRNAAMLLALQDGAYEEAVTLAAEAKARGAIDALLCGMSGHALSKLGRHAEAATDYVEARKLGPDDPYVRHLVAISGYAPEPDAAPADYVRAVFDGYAPVFESHLIGLGYRVPGLVRAALLRHAAPGPARPFGPVLDIGCGTGLVAVALLGVPAGPLVGVDLSPRMLDAAAAKRLYATLHEADALDFLRGGNGAAFQAIIAADMLCYAGALEPWLAAMRARLAPDGLCIFSVETFGADPVTEAGWRLGRQGRYQHSAAYVGTAAEAAGFRCAEIAEEALRNDFGVPVPGLIVVLRPA